MNDHHNGPRVKLLELREYVSERTGRSYFAGYLGSARVVMLRDDRAECTGKEKARWSVLLEDAPPREPARKQADTGGRDGRRQLVRSAPRAGRTAADKRADAVLRSNSLDPNSPMRDDALPF